MCRTCRPCRPRGSRPCPAPGRRAPSATPRSPFSAPCGRAQSPRLAGPLLRSPYTNGKKKGSQARPRVSPAWRLCVCWRLASPSLRRQMRAGTARTSTRRRQPRSERSCDTHRFAPPASGETMTTFEISKLLRMYWMAEGSAYNFGPRRTQRKEEQRVVY